MAVLEFSIKDADEISTLVATSATVSAARAVRLRRPSALANLRPANAPSIAAVAATSPTPSSVF
ncbi:hypothetical protein ID850_06565 [Xenorhabdus sp. Flor]|uniref:hypothetical protein n=1 Tax=Xenorhabdus cabanillasii TaxID=351673 RepID=UPI0019ABFAC2|nr:hypothetical protein [Xenorhabdus sp. Flor]MBD2814431.1 hypothetical protein [Xenorhabdus sp. Flor]